MEVWKEPIEFEWDEGNREKNWVKHKVSSVEAEEVFDNEPLLVSEDEKHSSKEKRHQALGRTDKNRNLFLSFTTRNEKVRIISVRDMSKREEKTYEKA